MASGPIFDSQHNIITLGKELGRGGEGVVFEIQGRPESVAKTYLKPVSPSHAAKLKAMTEMATDQLLCLAAWPTTTLHDRSGSIIGFMMPKVSGFQPAFKLYGPKLRLQEFPQADWRFLIHAAANTARAFSALHSAGFVIGDVNHGNLVVDAKATVRVWDCDSFQVSTGPHTWFCEVGVGTHQPPEMQGLSSYTGVVRRPNHDNFGLAVLIFQLLCMNRHPFMGRYSGPGETPSIEDAIAQSRYAYSRDRGRTAMTPPNASLPMEALTPEIRDLFETAFDPSARNGSRPTADKWIPALQRLGSSLRACSHNHSHYFLSNLPKCPWCEIEAISGTLLFPISFVAGPGAAVGIAALWQEVTQTREPAPLPRLQEPSLAGKSSASVPARGVHEQALQAAAWLACPLSLGAAITLAPGGVSLAILIAFLAAASLIVKWTENPAQVAAKAKFQSVRKEWAALLTAWNSAARETGFSAVRRELDALKSKYDDLPNQRAKRLQHLGEQARGKQFQAYLDRFPIASARISGIGRAKVATLSSHGIDTAGDVDFGRVIQVPGFGPATTNKLIAWRKALEQSFRFDPKQGIPSSDLAAIERDILLSRQALERDLKSGLGRLRALASSIETKRRTLEGRATELIPKYAQAAMDAKAPGDHSRRYKFLLGLSAATACLVPLLMLQSPNASPPSRQSATARTVITGMPPVSLPARATSPDKPPLPPRAPQKVLTIQNPAEHQIVVPVPEKVIMRQSAYARRGPDNTAAIVGTIPGGTILSAYDRHNGWVQVGYDEPWGWVYSAMLKSFP